MSKKQGKAWSDVKPEEIKSIFEERGIDKDLAYNAAAKRRERKARDRRSSAERGLNMREPFEEDHVIECLLRIEDLLERALGVNGKHLRRRGESQSGSSSPRQSSGPSQDGSCQNGDHA